MWSTKTVLALAFITSAVPTLAQAQDADFTKRSDDLQARDPFGHPYGQGGFAGPHGGFSHFQARGRHGRGGSKHRGARSHGSHGAHYARGRGGGGGSKGSTVISDIASLLKGGSHGPVDRRGEGKRILGDIASILKGGGHGPVARDTYSLNELWDGIKQSFHLRSDGGLDFDARSFALPGMEIPQTSVDHTFHRGGVGRSIDELD